MFHGLVDWITEAPEMKGCTAPIHLDVTEVVKVLSPIEQAKTEWCSA